MTKILLKEKLKDIQSLHRFFHNSDIVIKPKIGKWGGRVFSIESTDFPRCTFKMKEMVRHLCYLFRNSTKRPHVVIQLKEILQKISEIDAAGNKAIKKGTCCQKYLTRIRQIFGNLFYPKNKKLKALNALVQKEAKKLFSKGKALGEESTAAKYFEQASQLGHAGAKFRLALRYFKQDKLLAAKLYQEASLLGHAKATYNLGLMYHEGDEVPQSLEKGRELFFKAAKKGLEEAYFALGNLYREGTGVPQNKTKAFQYYQEGAKKNHPESLYSVGTMLSEGEGIPQDKAKAATYFEKGALLGQKESQLNLALMLKKGEGVPVDFSKAVRWLTPLANEGDAEAQIELACLYSIGSSNLPIDDQKAFEWLEKAVALGNAGAKYRLSEFYEEGTCVDKDLVRAASLLKEAADVGHDDSALEIGIKYFQDLDCESAKKYLKKVSKNKTKANYYLGKIFLHEGKPSEALNYFKEAAEANHAKAQLEYGKLLALDGDETDPQIERAIHFLKLALDNGEKEARAILFSCYHSLGKKGEDKASNLLQEMVQEEDVYGFYMKGITHYLEIPRDFEKSAFWLKKAADLQHKESQFYYAKLLEPINLEEANRYYQEAALQGEPNALFHIGKELYEKGLEKDRQQALAYLKAAKEAEVIGAKEYYDLLPGEVPQIDECANFQKLFTEVESNPDNEWAMYDLAKCYEHGLGVLQNTIEAVKCYEKAANHGCLDSKFQWALMLYDVPQVQDQAKALQLIDELEEAGFEEAFSFIQRIFVTDPVYKEELIKSAEVNKTPRDLYLLGLLNYKSGEFEKALHYFEQSAPGYVRSQYYLGLMLINGEGRSDQEGGIRELTLAAEKRYLPAVLKLAEELQKTKGVRQAIKWIVIATQLKDFNSLIKLANIFEKGADGVEVNFVEAAKIYTWVGRFNYERHFTEGAHYKEEALAYFAKGAELGYAEAQYHFGLLALEIGKTERNKKFAIDQIRKAAEQGFPEAEFYYGKTLYQDDFPENKEKGLMFLRSAKNHEFLDAGLFLEAQGLV